MKIQTIIDALKKIEKLTGYTYTFELFSDGSVCINQSKAKTYMVINQVWDFPTQDEFIKKIDELIEESKKNVDDIVYNYYTVNMKRRERQ